MTGMKFLTGEPALLIGKSLIIADLHLGIEVDYYQSGIKIPSQTEKIRKKLDVLLQRTGAKKLIILGDVKHKVPGSSFQEEKEVPVFFEQILKKREVEILPGNHDADLSGLVPDLVLRPSTGMLVEGYFLSHGHTWPGKGFLKAKAVIIGHDHPAVEFRSSIGYRWIEPVWVRAGFDKKKIMERYELKTLPGKLPELIIMPAFNDFSGALPLNRKFESADKEPGLGPLTKAADMRHARISLLDGTFLGLLKKL